LEEVVSATGFDDLVIERADDAGFENLDLRLAWLFLAFGDRETALPAGRSRSLAATTKTTAKNRRLQDVQQLRVRKLTLLQDRVHRQMLEVIAWHLVQLRLARRRDDHAEIERVALELRLHGEGFDLFGLVPGDKHLLGGLQNVSVLGGEVAARRL